MKVCTCSHISSVGAIVCVSAGGNKTLHFSRHTLVPTTWHQLNDLISIFKECFNTPFLKMSPFLEASRVTISLSSVCDGRRGNEKPLQRIWGWLRLARGAEKSGALGQRLLPSYKRLHVSLEQKRALQYLTWITSRSLKGQLVVAQVSVIKFYFFVFRVKNTV